MMRNRLMALLVMTLLTGCSFHEMACDRPENMQAVERTFAAHIFTLVADIENLKKSIPGLTRVGSDAELGRLLDDFRIPELQLGSVQEETRHSFGARTCSAQIGAMFAGVEKQYPLRYELERDGFVAGPVFKFNDPSVATTAFEIVEHALMAKRRAVAVASYKEQSEIAREAGFSDLREYQRQQAVLTQEAVLDAERQRVDREIVETLQRLEDTRAAQSVLSEQILQAENAYQVFLQELKAGGHLALGAQALQIQDIELMFTGDEGEPTVSMTALNTGSLTLAGADIEVSLFLNGGKEPFLISGDRAGGGRFMLRFKEPALQPQQALKVTAISSGSAEDWRGPEVITASRRQLVVRVLETFTSEGRNPETGALADPYIRTLTLQQRAEQLAQDVVLLNSRLAEQQTGYERIERTLSELGQKVPDA